MIGNHLRVLQLTLVLRVGGDAGRAKHVVVDPGLDARRDGPALDHPVAFCWLHALRLVSLTAGGAEQRTIGVTGGDVHHAWHAIAPVVSPSPRPLCETLLSAGGLASYTPRTRADLILPRHLAMQN